MKVAFITRTTLYTIHGGGAVQVIETARHLRELGVIVNIYLANQKIDYDQYDLLHFFDIIRPSNILYHIKKTKTPFVVSPVLVDYSEYDTKYRKGFSGFIFRRLTPDGIEYIKTITRWLLRKDALPGKAYIWKGHRKSIMDVLTKATYVLPNSNAETEQLKKKYPFSKPFFVIPNGIDDKIFNTDGKVTKDANLIVCAARIEGIKNQFNLIKALNGTSYKLLLIGNPSPNQKAYYNECRKLAGLNIEFIEMVSQTVLAEYFRKASVHILPSWFETCGLSSLEAAAMGCNIVTTNRGFARDYFGDLAEYCDPADPIAIFEAVKKALNSKTPDSLRTYVIKKYTWKHASAATLEVYKKIISK